MRINCFYFFLYVLISLQQQHLFGADANTASSCTTGNFSLPFSQQPSPLLSFGENILGRNQAQVLFFGDDFIDEDQHFVDLIPQILYGITDSFSVFFNLPIAASYKANQNHSSGLEDLFVQFEYALFTGQYPCAVDQVTLVFNTSFPTGSTQKKPTTGFGAVAYFVGTTYNRTWENWYVFTSYGAELPMSHQGTQFGNQFLYQFGFGRNIATPKGWILAWMTEITGTFSARNQIQGKTDPNSGGNVVYLTPSFWASSTDWILQIGFGFAVQQNLFGIQNRDKYLLGFNFVRTFGGKSE